MTHPFPPPRSSDLPSSRPPAAGAHVDPAVDATVAAVLRRSGDCRRRGPAMEVTDVSFVILGAVALWTGWRVFRTDSMVRASFSLMLSFIAVGLIMLLDRKSTRLNSSH